MWSGGGSRLGFGFGFGFGFGGAPNGVVVFFAGDASSSKKSSSSPFASSRNGEGAVAVAAADPFALASKNAASAPMRDTASVSTLGVSPPNRAPSPPVFRSTHPARLCSTIAGAASANAGVALAVPSAAGPNAEAESTRWNPRAGRSSEVDAAVADVAVADNDGRASDVPPGRDPDEDQIGVVASPSSSWSLTSGHSSSLSSSPAFVRPELAAPGAVSRAAMAPPPTHWRRLEQWSCLLKSPEGFLGAATRNECQFLLSGRAEAGPPLPFARLRHAAAAAVAGPTARLSR